jgi:lipid-binding SYLF domain-containing protein
MLFETSPAQGRNEIISLLDWLSIFIIESKNQLLNITSLENIADMKSGSSLFACICLVTSMVLVQKTSIAQNSKDRQLVSDSKDAESDFIHTDGLMKNLFSNAYGYAIFPTIGKGAFGVGGAGGSGAVYEKGNAVGRASMTQITVGFQAGGQAYREVIFFENKETVDRFKDNKVEFSAQTSAVAAKAGGSANVKYTNGIMIFTHQKGGLMFEASVGGQKFKYTAF